MLKITIECENTAKKSVWMSAWIRRTISAVLDTERLVKNAEVSVLLTDDQGIRAINKSYREKDVPTDVLSFPANALAKPLKEAMDQGFAPERDIQSGRLFLGDIAISMERAAAQAEEYRHTFKRELAFLTVHAMLHLSGYDHESAEGEAVMLEKQKLILERLKIQR